MVHSSPKSKIQSSPKTHKTIDAYCKSDRLTVRLQSPENLMLLGGTKGEFSEPMKRLVGMGLSIATAQIVHSKLAVLSPAQRQRLSLELSALAHIQWSSSYSPLADLQRRCTTHQKLIVFDLDETLVHSSADLTTADFCIDLPDERICVQVRPHALACLRELSQHFEIAVYTAGKEEYARKVLEFLDPQGEIIQHRLYRESCLAMGPLLLKDLRLFRDFALKDILMVDNSALGFALQRDNGVPVNTWTGDRSDSELLTLAEYLKLFKTLADVRPFNHSVFSALYTN